MQDQLAVRMSDGCEHFEEQPHARANIERARLTPAIQRRTLHVLQNEVRLPVVGHTGIDQPRDVRVIQPREYLAFLPKALDPLRIHQREIEELDCRAPFEAAVDTTREPHGAHTALSERLFECVVADQALHC